MHLVQRNNTLSAEIEIAGAATITRLRADGTPMTDTLELIECGRYGAPQRHSDPFIGARVNFHARAKAEVSIANPVGIYFGGLDTQEWETPDGSDPSEFWRYTRGTEDRPVRAVIEVPADRGFVLGDVVIDGRPIQFGGQIADRIQMTIRALATRIGQSTAEPVRGCVGDVAGPAFGLAPQAMPSVQAVLAASSVRGTAGDRPEAGSARRARHSGAELGGGPGDRGGSPDPLRAADRAPAAPAAHVRGGRPGGAGHHRRAQRRGGAGHPGARQPGAADRRQADGGAGLSRSRRPRRRRNGDRRAHLAPRHRRLVLSRCDEPGRLDPARTPDLQGQRFDVAESLNFRLPEEALGVGAARVPAEPGQRARRRGPCRWPSRRRRRSASPVSAAQGSGDRPALRSASDPSATVTPSAMHFDYLRPTCSGPIRWQRSSGRRSSSTATG